MAKPSNRTFTSLFLELADGQHGVVSRRQLVEAGVAESMIDGRRSAGYLLNVCPGVFAVGRPIDSTEGFWTAALLAAGPHAILARESAAVLWGLIPAGIRSVEIVRRDSRKPRAFRLGPPGSARPVAVRITRSDRLGPGEVALRRGFSSTALERTVLDLCVAAGEPTAKRAFSEADRLGLLRAERLAEYVRSNPYLAGIGLFRKLVEARHPEAALTRSELEVMFLEICAKAGLPTPRVNHRVMGFEVDCLWPEQRFVIELDGLEFHRGRMSFLNDANRDFALRRAGYRVGRLTFGMVRDDPEAVTEYVRNELNLAPGRSGGK